MTDNWIEIEQLAASSNKGVSTVRKYLKDLSQGKKDLYIKKIQLEGKGGIKHLYHKDLITLLFFNDKDDKETINTAQSDDKNQNGSSENIIDILRGQIEFLTKQIDIKDGQITSVSNENRELIERIRETNVLLLNTQKQLSAPVEKDNTEGVKWWQFWK